MEEPRAPGYAEGYLALFSNCVDETTVAAAKNGDLDAREIIMKIAKNASDGLVGRKKEAFFYEWLAGLHDYWNHLQEANNRADERDLTGDERENFVKGTWWVSNDFKNHSP